ncbi:hypothetical protein [[Muricauda] lutisoli]|uniref:DUF1579 domain-containing protein n=1 Tax=[Muricauda] lutisoli TaxID=2816035 RepID=A0ABS3ESX0_9FLAO|nr:hypothetical protein [[Muricauda] lutisoli]MBO0329228.1 hypothetical protein [[Muricauda] lutisoli]
MRRLVCIFTLFFCLGLQAQEPANCNCCSKDHKAFDFWIGEWEVVNSKDGSPAGSSVIQKEEDGCVIRENWTSAKAGYTGTSLNFFNAQSNQWEQLWIDNGGSFLKLKGNRKGSQMVLMSEEFIKADGKKYWNRITWTKNNNGTVRQLWEVLDESGNASIAFDGLYRKHTK